MPEYRPLKHIIIGAGALVFNAHAKAFDLPTMDLVGCCGSGSEAGRKNTTNLGVPYSTDYRGMIADMQPDVAVILTPHPLHMEMAVTCLEAGCHVLVEKPMAVTVSEADRINAAAKAAGRLLGVSYQMRFKPEVIAAKKLISEGKLGKLQRVTLIMPWARSRRYFTVGGWRATWIGEGGGVLINQAIHDLDLLVHLAGMPHRVVAWTRTRFHDIETEDSACAMLEWSYGALGQVSVSTAEAGPRQSIDLVGTGGMLSVGTGKLSWRPFEQDVYDYLGQTEELFTGPNWGEQEIELPLGSGDHRAVYQNFHAAILEKQAVMVDGEEGIKSLELANAMVFSSHRHCEVQFPLDRVAYDELMAELRSI